MISAVEHKTTWMERQDRSQCSVCSLVSLTTFHFIILHPSKLSPCRIQVQSGQFLTQYWIPSDNCGHGNITAAGGRADSDRPFLLTAFWSVALMPPPPPAGRMRGRAPSHTGRASAVHAGALKSRNRLIQGASPSCGQPR